MELPQRDSELISLLRKDLAEADAELAKIESQVREHRDKRNRYSRALSALDPTWADSRPGSKPGPKTGKSYAGASNTRVSEERLVKVSRILQERFSGRSFNAQEAAEVVALHVTTVHKVLKLLHDQGRIQLDHLGGPRNTTRYYRMPEPERPPDE